MPLRVSVLLFVFSLFTGCVSHSTTAVPLTVLNAGDDTLMWRLKVDSVPHIFVGGIPAKGSDVKRVTPFFLLPEPLWNEFDFGIGLQEDGYSILAKTRNGNVWTRSTLSEPRVYRLLEIAGVRKLEAISSPIPTSATRVEILQILAASLDLEVTEKKSGHEELGHWSEGPRD